MIDHGQPIETWVKGHKGFSEAERLALCSLSGVRTVGDLQVVLGDLPKELAAKVKKALGE